LLERNGHEEEIGVGLACRHAVIALVLVILGPALLYATHSTVVEHDGLQYFLATERDTYTMYEFVPMDYIVTNITEEPIPIEHPCVGLGGISFVVWDPVTPFHPESEVVWFCCGCFTESWQDTLEPGASYTKHAEWDMYDLYREALIWRSGTYTIEGTFDAWWGDLDLSQILELEIEILSGAASVPELPSTWGAIKALHR
jgi:hypothetical protein